MSNHNLKTELERLNIVSLECDESARKVDVCKALNAVELDMKSRPDKEALNRIQQLVKEKKARRFK